MQHSVGHSKQPGTVEHLATVCTVPHLEREPALPPHRPGQDLHTLHHTASGHPALTRRAGKQFHTGAAPAWDGCKQGWQRTGKERGFT